MVSLRIKSILVAMAILIASFSLALPTKLQALSGSEFQAGRIMDDSKFFSEPTMSVADIQNFLNSKVPVCDTQGTQGPYNGYPTRAAYGTANGNPPPYTCLRNYHTSIPAKSAEAGLCNGQIASGAWAAEIISWVAQSCGINPQVLIVLLQKEQSLITDDWPWPIQYRSATGYGCPDGAPCDAEYYGFFNQVYNAARQFKRYALNPTQYNFRANMNANILYHPNGACGSSPVFLQNQATAGLYNYTPYQPNAAALNNLYGTGDGCSSYGNRNFWRLFNDWFGSTFGPPDLSCKSGTNIGGAGPGAKVLANQFFATGNAQFTLSLLNETGSKCVEMHVWNSNQQAWLANVATNLPAVNPPDGEIIIGNMYADNRSEPMLVSSRTTGSGRLEVHSWDISYQRWSSNIATSHPVTNPVDSDVVPADLNGDGYDELVFVKYANTGSGKVEMHGWRGDLQAWIFNIPTNLPTFNPSDGRVIAANQYGGPADELVYVKYRNTGSGMVELHTWDHSVQAWLSNIATNHPAVSPDDVNVTAGNIYGGAIDELVFVKYRNTGSGRTEIHTWAPGQQAWLSNVATNMPTF